MVERALIRWWILCSEGLGVRSTLDLGVDLMSSGMYDGGLFPCPDGVLEVGNKWSFHKWVDKVGGGWK